MDEPIVEIKSLYKVFGEKPEDVMPKVKDGISKSDLLDKTGHTIGLRNINLEVYKGEIFVIMGLSGSGKSTLIRHFNRLIDPTSGEIVIDGRDIMKLSNKDLEKFRRDTMSMVFQNFALLPHNTIIENVAYGLKIKGFPKEERNRKAREWLKTVGLDGYEDQYPSQLSGGQKQRVGLARALAMDTEILLMDEAFSALDPLIKSQMQDQLIDLQDKLHKTIVFITHNLDEALRLGNRIAILKDGELVQNGSPEEILLNPANQYVEDFVKDVNRARALTVETVMKSPSLRITESSMEEALKQMRKHPLDYGYYINEEGNYKGVILQDRLEEAVENCEEDGKWIDIPDAIVEETAQISESDTVEEVMVDVISSDHPIPVVNEEGEVTGEVSKESLKKVFD